MQSVFSPPSSSSLLHPETLLWLKPHQRSRSLFVFSSVPSGKEVHLSFQHRANRITKPALFPARKMQPVSTHPCPPPLLKLWSMPQLRSDSTAAIAHIFYNVLKKSWACSELCCFFSSFFFFFYHRHSPSTPPVARNQDQGCCKLTSLKRTLSVWFYILHHITILHFWRIDVPKPQADIRS